MRRTRMAVMILVLAAACGQASIWTPLSRITDFAAYWAASRQMLGGHNPYAIAEVLHLEQGLGFTGSAPLIMRNPPWTIPLVMPLGLLPYPSAQMLWLFVSLASLLFSVHALWRFYGGNSRIWIPATVLATFLPVAAVLAVGQIDPLPLLGIAGFLHFQRKRWDGWAGISALLIALKPHLFFLFWLAVVLWALRERRGRVLSGLAGALALASATSLCFNPAVFSQYLHYWKEENLIGELIPTLSGVLRVAAGAGGQWLALLPVAAAITWFVCHWHGNKQRWDWAEEIPLLLVISMATTPYAWLFDQAILLPAILQVAALKSVESAVTRRPMVVLYMLVNTLTLLLILSHRTAFWYCWTAPAWLLIYLWAHRKQLPGIRRQIYS